MIGVLNHTYAVHRIAWMMHHNAPIPEGLTIDHLCYNGLCVNVHHFDVVDRAVNFQRAVEHYGWGASLRVRESRKGTLAYQVLWVERTDGKKTQRGRTFKSREEAESFMAAIRGEPAA